MRIINIIVLALSLSACASMVNVDYDYETNFNSYKTYKVNTTPVRVSEDTRINSPFMQQRVVSELNKAFKNKGFKKLSKNPTSNESFDVQYHLDIKQDFETQDSGAVSIGMGSYSHHSSVGFGFTIPVGEAYSIDLLVLTIDLVSSKSKELIWRGSLGYHLYEGATPETYTTLIKNLVTEILKEYPPK